MSWTDYPGYLHSSQSKECSGSTMPSFSDLRPRIKPRSRLSPALAAMQWSLPLCCSEACHFPVRSFNSVPDFLQFSHLKPNLFELNSSFECSMYQPRGNISPNSLEESMRSTPRVSVSVPRYHFWLKAFASQTKPVVALWNLLGRAQGSLLLLCVAFVVQLYQLRTCLRYGSSVHGIPQ